MNVDQVIRYSGLEPWRTIDNEQEQNVKEGTKLTGTLLPTQKSFLLFFAGRTQFCTCHSFFLINHSIPISPSSYCVGLGLWPLLSTETQGGGGHLGEASLNFKRHKKESSNLFNSVRSSWVIWIRGSKYVAMSDTRGHVDGRTRRRNDPVLSFRNNQPGSSFVLVCSFYIR